MIILLLLIVVSLSIALVFLIAFVWSVRSGQYDDPYTPSVRILFENEVLLRAKRDNQRTFHPDGPQKKAQGIGEDLSKSAPGKHPDPDANS
jgi:cbb3-type cytochrome oxidase maturation protein